MAKSLLPLGGFRCVGRSARPLFARPEAMLFQMRQLEAHCRALWARRLARPGAGRQDVFLLDYLPPAGPGQQPLRPFQRLPRRRVQHDRRGAGGGDADRVAPPPQVALCARHRAPPCAACVQRGAEHCCQRAHEGHRMDAAQARVAARALGLPPPGRTRTAAPAALSTLAAPAGAARPARGRRRGRGPRSTAAAGGPVCATPGPALCRLRAAGRRALLPAGARRAPHGRGTSTRGGASTAGVAAARAAGRGRPRGGVPGRTGLAQRSQTTPPAIILARARDATSTPGARARATPRGAPAPPPPKRLQGGGTQLKRLRYVKPAGGAQAALPALPAPPSGSHRARGGTRSPSATRASRTPGRTRTRGGGTAASPPPPSPPGGWRTFSGTSPAG